MRVQSKLVPVLETLREFSGAGCASSLLIKNDLK